MASRTTCYRIRCSVKFQVVFFLRNRRYINPYNTRKYLKMMRNYTNGEKMDLVLYITILAAKFKLTGDVALSGRKLDCECFDAANLRRVGFYTYRYPVRWCCDAMYNT